MLKIYIKSQHEVCYIIPKLPMSHVTLEDYDRYAGPLVLLVR